MLFCVLLIYDIIIYIEYYRIYIVFNFKTEQLCRVLQKSMCETKQTLLQAGSHQDVCHLMSSDVICGQAVPPFMALSGALPAMLNGKLFGLPAWQSEARQHETVLGCPL